MLSEGQSTQECVVSVKAAFIVGAFLLCVSGVTSGPSGFAACEPDMFPFTSENPTPPVCVPRISNVQVTECHPSERVGEAHSTEFYTGGEELRELGTLSTSLRAFRPCPAVYHHAWGRGFSN